MEFVMGLPLNSRPFFDEFDQYDNFDDINITNIKIKNIARKLLFDHIFTNHSAQVT